MQKRFESREVRGRFVAAAVGLVAIAAGCGNLSEPRPRAVAYSPGGELVVFLDGEVRFFDADAQHALGSIQTPSQVGGWTPFPLRFAASSDGTTVAIGVDRTVQVYSVETRKNVASIIVEPNVGEFRPIVGITLSPHGDLVAVSTAPYYTTEAPSLTVWRVADQTRVAAVNPPADRPDWSWRGTLAFSPDASTLYGIGLYVPNQGLPNEGLPTSYVSAWSAETGGLVWESESLPLVVEDLALSADGSTVSAVGSTIHLWRAADGSKLQFQANFATEFNTVALSPNGQELVLTGWINDRPDPQVIGPDGAVLWATPRVSQVYCQSGVFSPDGARVAAICDLDLKIWSAQDGASIQDLKVAGPVY